jgi:single-strand DNA-binding protein
MSTHLNRVQLIGHLGRDPEARFTQTGSKVITLSLATSESWKDGRSGERRERTEWHRVAVFNEHLGTLAEKYLVRGSKVFIEGALRTRKWQDPSGADRTSTEIHVTPYNGTVILLDRKPNDDRASADNHGPREPDDSHTDCRDHDGDCVPS